MRKEENHVDFLPGAAQWREQKLSGDEGLAFMQNLACPAKGIVYFANLGANVKLIVFFPMVHGMGAGDELVFSDCGVDPVCSMGLRGL